MTEGGWRNGVRTEEMLGISRSCEGGKEIEWRSVCVHPIGRGMRYRGGRGKCMGRKVAEERLDRVVISVWKTERSVCTFQSPRFFL